MATYVMLAHFTERGIMNVKNSKTRRVGSKFAALYRSLLWHSSPIRCAATMRPQLRADRPCTGWLDTAARNQCNIRSVMMGLARIGCRSAKYL